MASVKKHLAVYGAAWCVFIVLIASFAGLALTLDPNPTPETACPPHVDPYSSNECVYQP
jgi:hypothetical protein